jgi:hypothetical protein
MKQGTKRAKRKPRDMAQLHAEDALRARIDALQAHLRPSCFRVIASTCFDNTLYVIEQLHQGSEFVYVLPDDDLEALRLVKDLQRLHDQEYQVHVSLPEWR